jgi:hypothetical protein
LEKQHFLTHSIPYKKSGKFVDHLVFTSLDFATITFYRARPSALHLTLNQEEKISLFMSPSDRVAQLHPQALGSPFVAFYDSQGFTYQCP